MANRPEMNTIYFQHYRARDFGVKSAFTLEDWQRIMAQYENKCAYCGIEDKLVPDHVIPMSRGGENTPDNIKPSCRRCNSKKQDSTPEEWQSRTSERRPSNRKSTRKPGENRGGARPNTGGSHGGGRPRIYQDVKQIHLALDGETRGLIDQYMAKNSVSKAEAIRRAVKMLTVWDEEALGDI